MNDFARRMMFDRRNLYGSRGRDDYHREKFSMEQIRPIAEQMGIQFREYSPYTLMSAVNMLYDTFSKVLGQDTMMYVKLGKAFLEDENFDGTPEDKRAFLEKRPILSSLTKTQKAN